MEDKYMLAQISAKDFSSLVDKYNKVVPDKLSDLEEQRLRIIPAALSKRGKNAYLEASELQTLVEWKLAHGTFRPSLRKLVASNAEDTVQEATRAAFAKYASNHDEWAESVSKLAADLRGVGPATASLLLSVTDSENVPFFSDELFRWMMWEEGRGNGWDRKMKYTIGEYKQMFPRVSDLRKRLEAESDKTITALDVEMAAYALARGEKDSEDVQESYKDGSPLTGRKRAQDKEDKEDKKAKQPVKRRRRGN